MGRSLCEAAPNRDDTAGQALPGFSGPLKPSAGAPGRQGSQNCALFPDQQAETQTGRVEPGRESEGAGLGLALSLGSCVTLGR